MDSRVVLITGSSSGIGKSCALLFAKNGYKVVVHGYPSKEEVSKVVDECVKLSPNNNKALGLVVDFSNPDNADIVVNKTIEHFGSLDVLVNNAGIYCDPNCFDGRLLYENYQKIRAVNIDATVKVTYSAIEHLRKSNKSPNIVFMSSHAALKPFKACTGYCVAKAAMTMFAKCIALELAPKIRCNILSPGVVDTPIYQGTGIYNEEGKWVLANQTLMKRIGQPEEIADAVMYLADEKASWITGTDLLIDGGALIADTHN